MNSSCSGQENPAIFGRNIWDRTGAEPGLTKYSSNIFPDYLNIDRVRGVLESDMIFKKPSIISVFA